MGHVYNVMDATEMNCLESFFLSQICKDPAPEDSRDPTMVIVGNKAKGQDAFTT
jgi:hypothetical protein